ncbi:MAG: glutaredoxin family protein [Dehalococcoidia bacterium]
MTSSNRPAIVTLYTASPCSLCEEARSELQGLAGRLPFRLEVVAVDDAGGRRADYRDCVPVVELNGAEIARAPIRKGVLETRLTDALAAGA